jgi:hypothetical protein
MFTSILQAICKVDFWNSHGKWLLLFTVVLHYKEFASLCAVPMSINSQNLFYLPGKARRTIFS